MVPTEMRAVKISTIGGGPEALAVTMCPMPAPGPGEVLVRISAAGVNRGDLGQRRGSYPPPPGVTDIPGLEFSGHVVALGPGTTLWKEGDAVCALVAGGGYSEYCAVPERQCLRIPRGISLAEAASLPETFATVWSTLWQQANLQPGESLLVHGGASGIGVSAIQLAAARAHRVFTTAGSDARCDSCRALGADVAINYKNQDFAKEIREATNGKGVDVILDMVGGDYVAREISILAEQGRLVFIASLGGNIGQFDIKEVMFRRLSITGSTLRARSPEFKAKVIAGVEANVWPLIENGSIRPVVYAQFELGNVSKAHSLMEAGDQIGKVVLTVDQ